MNLNQILKALINTRFPVVVVFHVFQSAVPIYLSPFHKIEPVELSASHSPIYYGDSLVGDFSCRRLCRSRGGDGGAICPSARSRRAAVIVHRSQADGRPLAITERLSRLFPRVSHLAESAVRPSNNKQAAAAARARIRSDTQRINTGRDRTEKARASSRTRGNIRPR